MKEILRKKYLLIRNNIKNKDIKDNIIFNKVINNSRIKNASTILIYVSLEMEVDTKRLIKYFLKEKRVCVPKVIKDGVMQFYYINEINDLSVGYKGILEPTTKTIYKNDYDSVCIVPGICFNNEGYRIGYGKGFYDHFLEKYKGYKIGLCYQDLVIDEKFREEHDIKVDEIITE